MENWYVVHTKAGKESSVHSQLGECLPGVMLPTLKVRVRRWNKLVSTVAPLFPCYVFASFAIEQDLGRVRYAAGVRDVVRHGGGPAVVPSSIIEQLKLRCANGPIEYSSKPMRSGDPVIVAEGALCGFEAVFDQYLSGPQRAAIMLSSLMGTPVRVVLRASSLVPGA
jgi:transcriptional antiterminator RfaH